jgi:hypothetical protein
MDEMKWYPTDNGKSCKSWNVSPAASFIDLELSSRFSFRREALTLPCNCSFFVPWTAKTPQFYLPVPLASLEA